ncbi:helix-turn-helix domain-containing protein [uncultured Desulfovibrio sp.]|uniref:winged helix-turn-helix transcriptional regulator n=1 Tax=uncultured Desulfovibrio sp. TaxID=167968 RepID=UPI0026734261|nr:helix-turn-helix domain-containing protein [uncultured Desulfovibrio sp.]
MTTTPSNPRCVCTNEGCPLTSALNILGAKWRIQLICALNVDGPIRFNELKRRLPGISNTALTSALKGLEDFGLVERRHFMEIPPRVEYLITESCKEIIPLVTGLAQWGVKHQNMTWRED